MEPDPVVFDPPYVNPRDAFGQVVVDFFSDFRFDKPDGGVQISDAKLDHPQSVQIYELAVDYCNGAIVSTRQSKKRYNDSPKAYISDTKPPSTFEADIYAKVTKGGKELDMSIGHFTAVAWSGWYGALYDIL
jgi:hypothetical protein